ncbi:hypothetical protein QVD17_03211 [Tagetes erecta]|uniref:Uncharacterized protein n=1 Tax=Tagetes erecta TaxID=13708 RepID=A0AAD8L7Z3_TARER|nr:hypothetical protein QVD17_03211 [Tagetes erecta]
MFGGMIGVHIITSYLSSGWRWTSHNLSQMTTGRRLDTWIVDDILWNVVMAVESIVLASMLACYFIFCGCTL